MSKDFSPAALVVNGSDSVAVALRPIAAGEPVEFDIGTFIVNADIPQGHKFALSPHQMGDTVIKYGASIGRATAKIDVGDHVHTHNLASALTADSDLSFAPSSPLAKSAPDARTFLGYLREGGGVGIRNEIWILPTVGCVANTARRIAEKASALAAGKVDGVYAFTHPLGCSQLGDDLGRTRDILAALASHPNAGAVLVIGLGCENNKLAQLVAQIDQPANRIQTFEAQGVDDEIEAGVQAVQALIAVASNDRRQPVSLAHLRLGLKCGGSDAFSGLTANPLVGKIATRLAAAGGGPILTEIPELFGAEAALLNGSCNADVFAKGAELIQRFKAYFHDRGLPVSENPSPGNRQGGITTLEEKSLGAAQKAGEAVLVDVLNYGERASRSGLTLLEAPGNDAVSSTALVAAGAQMVLFTTGRGTPLGFPAPTIKIASNSALALAKSRWIDFDAGARLSGLSLDALSDHLMDLIIDTASGKPTRSETNGEREIALWKDGATL